MSTTVTVTQSTRTNPIITSVIWSTTKTTKVPLSMYNVPSARIWETPDARIQETPDSLMANPWPKPQGRERTPIPVHKIPLMEQQPATLIPKTTATATPAILPAMSIPSRGPTPWPTTVPASVNLFITRLWSLLPNKDNSPVPAVQKMIESDPSKTENTPRETIIPLPAPLIRGNFTTASGPATANIVAASRSQEKKWEPSCQCCSQSLSHPEQDWSEDDWDGEIQKAKQKEKQRKEEELKQNLTAEEHRATAVYYPQVHNTNQSMKKNPYFDERSATGTNPGRTLSL